MKNFWNCGISTGIGSSGVVGIIRDLPVYEENPRLCREVSIIVVMGLHI